jgi:hypothetical protein
MTSPVSWSPRLQGRPRLTAAALIVGVLLALWGVLAGSSIGDRKADPGDHHTDMALYEAIVSRMNHGQSYYHAAAIEQPALDYPTSPVMAVREPTLAWFIAAVGKPAAVVAMLALGAVALVLSIRTFELTERSRRSWVAAVLCSAAGIGVLCRPAAVVQHEVWAALLVYIGVLLRGHGQVVMSVVLLLAAALVRELVAPIMGIMLVLAVLERRRREQLIWALGLLAFGAFYAVHFWQFHHMHGQAGPPSPGWLRLGGWPFVIDAFWGSSLLTVFPHTVAAILVPLGLLGWLSRSGALADRVGAILVAYVVLFCVAGRPDNFYWGMLVEALLLPGVAFGVAFIAATCGASYRTLFRRTTDVNAPMRLPSGQGE